MVKFDEALQEINDFGKFQKIRYVLICLAGLLPPIATYIHSFIAALPEYKCKNNNENDSFNHSYVEFTQPKCNYIYNKTIYKCTSWDYDKTYFYSTLTEEWNMVCDRSFLRSNVQSIYFCGYLVGSIILGNLADRFGRRPIMLFSFFLILFGFIGSLIGPQKQFGFWISYIIYSLCRFLMACGTRGINETGYVLALELFSTKKRTYAGIGFEHFFSLGQLILVLVAYFVRDWRNLVLIMTIFVIPFLSYFYLLPESPRWLISRNRQKEALTIIEKVAKVNKKTFNVNTWNEILYQENQNENQETFLTLIKSLIKYPSQALLLFIMFLNWLVNNFVFYGVGLKSIDLGVNPYLSFAISASVEMIAYTSTLFIINKFGRKKPYFLFLLIVGLSCLSHSFISDLYIGVTLAMIGKFCVSASYAILRLYSNEIFPTSIRSSCMGACSMVSRMGVIIAPIINSLGENGWKQLPFLIFGVSALISALSTFILPETKDRKLPETIDDARKLNSKKNIVKMNKKKEILLKNSILEESRV